GGATIAASATRSLARRIAVRVWTVAPLRRVSSIADRVATSPTGSSAMLYAYRDRAVPSTRNVNPSYWPSVARAASLMDHSSASLAICRLATIGGVSKRLAIDGIADSRRTMRSPAARKDLAAFGSLMALHLDFVARDVTDACWETSASGRTGSLVKLGCGFASVFARCLMPSVRRLR